MTTIDEKLERIDRRLTVLRAMLERIRAENQAGKFIGPRTVKALEKRIRIDEAARERLYESDQVK